MNENIATKADEVEQALVGLGYQSAYREVDYAGVVRLTTSNVGSDEPLTGVIVSVYGDDDSDTV